ncbi:MarR family transcriptional regulator [Paenibacillus sp. IB182496]|uniref:MarR family transcriptional regulator n=1 Tax=Paenibacillus sabuli TaxID=2772509 RepID=A0A927BWG4_9BACL|nr:MarR family transcriptional regulator [Paenibacillus sabuli]MBD2846729.1 MarR family transcriptional regulator [Paenibacillus sabuli]
MEKKRCPFCHETVQVQANAEGVRYHGCRCAPEQAYLLCTSAEQALRDASPQDRGELLPLVSGALRERSEQGEQPELDAAALARIAALEDVPQSIEDKGKRLLCYVRRHSRDRRAGVVLRELQRQVNLTYSPNLQELVYIMTQLVDAGLLEREGYTLRLTEAGWETAGAEAAARADEHCVVLLADPGRMGPEWAENVLPVLAQCGYKPVLLEAEPGGEEPELRISRSTLVLADLAEHAQDVYFRAGLALGMNKPVIWTQPYSAGRRAASVSEWIQPLMWETTAELAQALHRRLGGGARPGSPREPAT